MPLLLSILEAYIKEKHFAIFKLTSKLDENATETSRADKKGKNFYIRTVPQAM